MQRPPFVRSAVFLLPLLVVALSFSSPARAQGSHSPQADPTAGQAPAQALGPSAEKIKSLRQAVQDDLDNVELRRRLAAALLAAGEPYPAIDQLDEAIRRAPDDALAQQMLGACYRRLGKADQAVAAYRKALAIDPSLVRARVGLSSVLATQGDLDGAIGELDTVLAQDPDRFGLLLVRADLQMRSGHPSRALPDLTHAIELHPQDVSVRLVHQDLLVQLGRYGGARKALETGLETIPDDPALTDALARLLAFCPDEAVCDPEQALALADRAYRAQSTPEHAATLALALAAGGRFDEAIQLQSQLLAAAKEGGAPEAVVKQLDEALGSYQRKERPELPSDPAAGSPPSGR